MVAINGAPLALPEDQNPRIQFNDGKVDRRGRFIVGSTDSNIGDCHEVFSYPMFLDLQREQKVFTDIAKYTDRDIMWMVIIHAVFVGSGVLLALMDKIHGDHEAESPLH